MILDSFRWFLVIWDGFGAVLRWFWGGFGWFNIGLMSRKNVEAFELKLLVDLPPGGVGGSFQNS